MKMLVIPPLRCADLPDRKTGFWQMTGPGAVMVGTAPYISFAVYTVGAKVAGWTGP